MHAGEPADRCTYIIKTRSLARPYCSTTSYIRHTRHNCKADVASTVRRRHKIDIINKQQHAYHRSSFPMVGRSAVAGVALAAVTAAAAVGGLAGLRRGLELGRRLLLRGDAQDDGGLRRGALLLQVGVLLAALAA